MKIFHNALQSYIYYQQTGGNVYLVPNSFGIGVDFTSPYSFEGYYGVHF